MPRKTPKNATRSNPPTIPSIVPNGVRVPSYRLHRASGKAVVTLSGRDHYLGEYNSPGSHERYRELLGRWLAGGKKLPAETPSAPLSVAEVLLSYLEYCEKHYASRRGCDALLARIKAALRPVRELFGSEPVDGFRAKALMLVRQKFIDAGHNRSTVNAKIGAIKRCFKWAAREEMIPVATYHSLSTVEGLRNGDAAVPESKPVPPVADDVVDAIRPHLSRQIWGLIQLQRWTGCRPGEAVSIRGIDIDRSGLVWIYKPEHFKSEHLGHQRAIALGPKAQEVITEFLRPGYLFDPREEERERLAARSAARRTPLSCGNRPEINRKRQRRRGPGSCWTACSYRVAIERACLKTWPLPESLRRKPGERSKAWRVRLGDRWSDVLRWKADHTFAPNQLRHLFGTKVRRDFGLDGAQVALGHAHADVTQVYAERDLQLAVEIARRIG
jgi:integrase